MSHRHNRRAMPMFLRPAAALLLTSALLSPPAFAQDKTPAPDSGLDAALFYQLLIGEMEAQRGELGTAYQVLLDAARRTGDEGLYRRAINLALQARAGSEALSAARDWRSQLGTLAAQQHVVRLAVALGRLEDAAEPLLDWLQLTPDTVQRAALLAALPQLFQNMPERHRPLDAMEPLLAAQRDLASAQPERRALAAGLIAALAQHAGNEVLALNQLRQSGQEWPEGALPAWQALELMRANPDAETLVLPQLAQSTPLRGAYARALARSQRAAQARQQFELLLAAEPDQAAHQYALAALQLDLREPKAALAAADAYLARLPAEGQVEQRRAARLLRVQALTQMRDWSTALAELDALTEPEAREDVAFRRASIEARRGQLDAARQRLRELPGDSPEQRERRLLLEIQVLRDAGQWPLAFELLTKALVDDPTNVDLLYEHAMGAERLGQFEQMEQQLRRVIELQPRHHHAHNALGYSLAERNLRLPEARTLIEKALELGGYDPFLVDSLGWLAFREGRLDEAERWLRWAHQARPDAEIAAHLAELLLRRGQQDEARAIADQAQQREPDNSLLRATRRRLGL
jgi:tetratricopeptide (TPR) repeat protein